MTATQLKGVTTTEIAGLTAGALGKLQDTQIALLASTQVGAHSATNFSALDATSIGALNATQLPGVTTAEIAGLTAGALGNLQDTQVALLASTRLARSRPPTWFLDATAADIPLATPGHVALPVLGWAAPSGRRAPPQARPASHRSSPHELLFCTPPPQAVASATGLAAVAAR